MAGEVEQSRAGAKLGGEGGGAWQGGCRRVDSAAMACAGYYLLHQQPLPHFSPRPCASERPIAELQQDLNPLSPLKGPDGHFGYSGHAF